jgi:hypothetical protein
LDSLRGSMLSRPFNVSKMARRLGRAAKAWHPANNRQIIGLSCFSVVLLPCIIIARYLAESRSGITCEGAAEPPPLHYTAPGAMLSRPHSEASLPNLTLVQCPVVCHCPVPGSMRGQCALDHGPAGRICSHGLACFRGPCKLKATYQRRKGRESMAPGDLLPPVPVDPEERRRWLERIASQGNRG